MSHMTQTANPVTLLASPLGEEGHKVAKGWTVVILIMILDVDVTAEGGIIKLIARKGDTTTLAAVVCVKLKNLKNFRGEAPSTLTPKVCPKAKPPRSSPPLFTLWYNISDYMPASVSLAESRAVK